MKKLLVKFSALAFMVAVIFACESPAEEKTAEAAEAPEATEIVEGEDEVEAPEAEVVEGDEVETEVEVAE
ncbi:MAG: hypothetical protein ACK4ND_13655 [Cytophagaceae bacterium]